MKKIKSLLTLFLIWNLIGVTQSCFNQCGSDGPWIFEPSSMEATAIKISGMELFGSSNTPYFILDNSPIDQEYLKFDSIGINIISELTSVSQKTDGLLSYSYACSPTIFYKKIISISVISSEDYRPDLESGVELNEILSIRHGLSKAGTRLDLFAEKGGSLENENLLITFNHPPTEAKSHNFTINVTMEDGKEFEMIVEGVLISN